MENTNQNFFERNMKWIIALVVIVVIVGWGVSKYNTFVVQGEQIRLRINIRDALI